MKKLLKDYCSVIFGTGFSRGISFITALVLARRLSVEGFGRFSMFFTIMMLAWQIPAIIDGVYVRYAKAGKEHHGPAYLRAALLIKLGIIFCMLVAAYPMARLLGGAVFRKPGLDVFIALAIVSGGLLSVLSSLAAVYQAEERFVAFSAVNAGFYVLVFAGVIGFIVRNAPLTDVNASLIFFAAAVVTGALAGAFLIKRIRPGFEVNPGLCKEMSHFGKWLFAEALVYIFLQRLDLLFLGRFAGYAEIGVYSAAVRIAMVASILTGAAAAIFMPRGCQALKSRSHLSAYFKEAAAATMGLTALIVVLIVASPIFVSRLFGSGYMQAVVPTRILLLEAVFVLMYTPFSFLFYASGETKKIFAIGMIRLLVMAGALWLLVPRLGPVGAAVSIAVSSLAGLVGAAALSGKAMRCNGPCEAVYTELIR